MAYLNNLIFLIILTIGIGFFVKNIKKIIRNIKLGQPINNPHPPKLRLKNMLRVALGQSKMVTKPIAGTLHIIVYIGFVIINLEVLEIIIDGLFGTHRIFAKLGTIYNLLIGSFEILAALVLLAVILFYIRRNIMNLKRFVHNDLNGWPKNDANYILYFEIVLMTLFLLMNATDLTLQHQHYQHYITAGSFPISQHLTPLFSSLQPSTTALLERSFWWMHITGILLFLNYLYYSKHLHILLAFPNTYLADLNPLGQLNNLGTVTTEVKLMMDPSAPTPETPTTPIKFGAQDATDLNQLQLLNAYTCTQCGRCTDACPANQTGKKLSPRKIMIDTRNRINEIGQNLDQNHGIHIPDNKTLLDNYITPEELWACTSCNACVQECPVNISPLSIIIELRRYLVMEQSSAPTALNNMMTNIENNGAPWQFNQQDRLNWNTQT